MEILKYNILKRLFCSHIFKEEKKEFLETKREILGSEGFMPVFSNYSYYAVYKKCIKCGKEKIVTKRVLNI